MSGRIALVRHGPSALTARGWLNRADVERFRIDYDSAGIQTHSSPPERVRRLAADAAHFVSSDMRRAMESAQRIAPDRPAATTTALLREVPLPLPRLRGRWPSVAWESLIHVAWGYRIVLNRDHEHDAQASDAGSWLRQLASDGSPVFAVTHGVIRRSIAQQLVAHGWRTYGARQRYHPWSAWEFTPPTLK
jgi:broad specificity phosphatase PhoE